ncbi:hypothetical protein SAMD00019534_113070 [Acytostelium subglobosum LB1]|uniref:hypothetical protein n=1 Tax=Acytostelium subglobosum LB1 TaxID=1410327 RepID=UPI000644A769|nr:hypothetical protein SAMD00019534_113070 [Acytostelium subglobosum LB1]GAM28131.1 hypothetical protein SAMD00019534_113070 [Acytostelium subglobosum LB1]|eukprot:XP_012748765.1 hypothetical protein SAMD00019534_113070 [Acytostelium subglobosum LB1]
MSTEEIDPKFIDECLGNVGGVFGEANTFNVWVEANKTPTPAASGFNKRLIVVGKYKLLSLKKGAFGKSIELDFHLYTITELNYIDNDETIVIKYQVEVNEQMQQMGMSIKAPLDKLQQLIRAIRTSYRQITVGFPSSNMFKLNYPEDKLLPFEGPLVMSPAHGYIDTYIAHSFFYKTNSTLDYVRYIEALAQNESDVLDFTHCPGNDPTSEISFNLFTAITSLRHNTYFKSIDLSGLPHANIISALGMCLETNQSITKLNLSNLRIEQSFQPLANGLAKNPTNKVQIIDFSKNTITYPVMATLCNCFSSLQHGLVSLDLSKCDLQPKTIPILFESFERNFGSSLSLKYLNLSHNKMGDIGSQMMASWMSKIKGYHNLQCLVLSNCALNFTIMGPPLRVLDVPRLDLSGNRIDRTSSKLLGDQVFDSVAALTDLNMSGCSLNAQSLEDMFVAFNRNRKIANFSINLSKNNLGANEATILAKSISGCRYLESLDISSNKLSCRSIIELVNAIKNIDRFNLHELNIGNNYFVIGPEGDQLCQLLAQFVNNFPTVRTLNICGGRYPLGKSLFHLVDPLINNKSLREIDLSENGLTDAMAPIIGELLRNNTTLNYMNLDNNQFGLSGWTSIAQPLLFDINRTLNHMVFAKTLANAYTSTLIQNFTLHQAFGNLSQNKRNHLIQLFLKIQDKLAENRFEASLDANSYVSEYAQRVLYSAPVSNEVIPLVPVPEHLSSLPLPPSPLAATTSNGGGGIEIKSSTIPQSASSLDLTHKRTTSTDSATRHTQSAAPPRALATQSSDWQPDETSEFEQGLETSSSSFVNYESSENESSGNSEHELSTGEDLKKNKKKARSNSSGSNSNRHPKNIQHTPSPQSNDE